VLATLKIEIHTLKIKEQNFFKKAMRDLPGFIPPYRCPAIVISRPKSIELLIEDKAFSPPYDVAPPQTLSVISTGNI
jgi:hypothetical protein